MKLGNSTPTRPPLSITRGRTSCGPYLARLAWALCFAATPALVWAPPLQGLLASSSDYREIQMSNYAIVVAKCDIRPWKFQLWGGG